MYGTIKFFNPKKHYGFIRTTDGQDYFFYETFLKNYGGKPNADDNVEFKVSEPNDKGSVCAYNVAQGIRQRASSSEIKEG